MRVLSIVIVLLSGSAKLCGESEVGQPRHGGVVQPAGNYFVELVPGPDGTLAAYVTDGQGNPAPVADVRVGAHVGTSGGPSATVALVPEPEQQRYVGRVVGIPAGAHPVEVTLGVGPAEMQVQYPDVTVAPAPGVAPPAYGGVVSTVGDRRVEVVTQPAGNVEVYVTDLAGQPMPAAEVEFPSVTIVHPGGPRVVTLRRQGDKYVGAVGAPLPERFGIELDLRPRGRPHPRVLLPGFVVAKGRGFFAAPPPPVVVTAPDVEVEVPAPPRVVVQAPPPPRVIVRPPPPPRVVVQVPPPPRVVVRPPPPPRVVVQAPPPPRVIVQPPPPPHIVLKAPRPPRVVVSPGHIRVPGPVILTPGGGRGHGHARGRERHGHRR